MYQIFIDSRDRDLTKWPNASQYDIHFDPKLQYVESIKLVASNIPRAPSVQDGQILLRANTQAPWTSYVLGAGDFGSAIDVQNIMQRFSCPMQVDEVPFNWVPGQNESVTVSGSTRKVLRFSSSSQFYMSIPDERLSRVLGFGSVVVNAASIQVSSGQWAVTAPYVQDTQFYTSCVGIVLDSDDFCCPIGIEGAAMRDAFAIVGCGSLCFGNHLAYLKTFDPPLGRVTRVRIKLIDRLGKLYDAGAEHSFQLQVCQKQ